MRLKGTYTYIMLEISQHPLMRPNKPLYQGQRSTLIQFIITRT